MARIVIHKEKSPVEVKIGDKSVWICRCGLTTNPPYCSGEHKKITDEKDQELYIYEGGRRYIVKKIEKSEI